MLIVGSVRTLTVPNFEDEGFVRHQAGELSSMPPVLRVFVRLGPDGVSSGGFRIFVTCDAELDEQGETDSTTTLAPTTTVAPSTTTLAPTTTAASTTEPPSTTSTVAPATTAPPTTGAVESTTTVATSGQQGDNPGSGSDSLPRTGAFSIRLTAIGVLLVVAGMIAMQLATLGARLRRSTVG